MPKARRQVVRRHVPSARSLATYSDDSAPLQQKTIDVEGGADFTGASAAEILAAITEDAKTEGDAPRMSKKDKMKLKHESFMKRLESSSTPYARPGPVVHPKKPKPKSLASMKQSLTAGMNDISSALDEILERQEEEDAQKAGGKQKKIKKKLIGKSKGKVSAAQRKQILKQEQRRLPLIQQHPAFVKNPFETIRLHAQNTLEKHERPADDHTLMEKQK